MSLGTSSQRRGTEGSIASLGCIEADDSNGSDIDELAATDSKYLISIASDIRHGIEENGRIYASYGNFKPWVPVDEEELDRNDFQHCKFTAVLSGKLYLAPITSKPQHILDLGTGSGIWAIDMADKFPDCEIVGVDTAAVQPNLVPPNVVFELDDAEKEWLWEKDHFDFIHIRELVLSIRDWPRLLHQAFTHTKPGGYVQLAGSVPDPKCDDEHGPGPKSAYMELCSDYFEMGERIGASGYDPTRWKDWMVAEGFSDVVEKIYKIPTNPWPKDPRLKQIGALEMMHFRDGVANIYARGYTQILGREKPYFEVTMAEARREVTNRKMHTYISFYIVYGKRPETTTTTTTATSTSSESKNS